LMLPQLRSVKDTVIPSKLLMYMAAGRPVLTAVNGASQAAAIVRDARCGIVVDAENAQALAAAVRDAQARSEERDSWGRRSREYAEKHFDRTAIVAAQQRVIEQVADGSLREPVVSLGR